MELAAELEASLRELAAAGPVEVHENGGRLASLSALSWEIRGPGEKPLLHLWSEQYNVTRRILGITDCSEGRLVLAAERFGRSKADRIEFVRTEFERSAREQSRSEFCERLRNILVTQFPDETLESLTISADLEHTLSGNYARESCGAAPAMPRFSRRPRANLPIRSATASRLVCCGSIACARRAAAAHSPVSGSFFQNIRAPASRSSSPLWTQVFE